jgi:hypothetical protein
MTASYVDRSSRSCHHHLFGDGIRHHPCSKQIEIDIAAAHDEPDALAAKFRLLHVEYSIDGYAWQSLVKQARFVFDGEAYFEVAE